MSLIKNSFIYLSTEIINKAIPFLLLPLITKYLSPVEYGAYAIYQVILSFIAPFIAMSLDIHITRKFFKISKKELSNILNSIFLILHINMLIALIIIYILSLWFDNVFGISSKILMIIPIIIYVQNINLFYLTILRNQEKALKYGLMQISLTLLNVIFILLLLIGIKLSWLSLVLSVLISQTILSFYSLYNLKKDFKLKLKFIPSSSLKEFYKISFPLIFHTLGGVFIFFSDRVMIKLFLGLKEVGIYSITNQFASITMIVINSIILAINPHIYKKLAKKLSIKKEIIFFMFIFVLVGIVIAFIDNFLFYFMTNENYHTSYVKEVIFVLVIAFIFRGWYQLFYNVIVDAGKTSIFMYITFGSGLLNVVLNYFFIPQIGVIGAAISTMIAFLFIFIFTAFKAIKILRENR